MGQSSIQYKLFSPGELSPVHYYWEIFCTDTDNSSYTILPSLYFNFVFPLNCSISIEGLTKPISQPFLSPILNTAKRIYLEPGSKIYGFHLKPEYVSSILRIMPKELIHCANTLEDVLINDIHKKVINTFNLSLSFEVFASEFENLLHTLLINNDPVISEIIYLIKTRPLKQFSEIANEVGYSQRWIQKKFKDKLGASPQQILSTIRFNLMIQNIYLNSTRSLTQLAFQSGYYDQSHSIREFKKFSLINPRQFKKELPTFNAVMNRF